MKKKDLGDPGQPRETAPVSPGGLAREGNLDNLGLICYIGLVADLVSDRCIDSIWSTDKLSDDSEHFLDILVSGLIS